MSTNRILYIGKDPVFIQSIKETLVKFLEDEEYSFQDIFFDEGEEDLITKFVPRVIDLKPTILIIDFSYRFEVIRLLARHLRLSLSSNWITCVGILNNPPESVENESDVGSSTHMNEMELASLTQLPIIHFKGNDTSKILFDALYLSCENKKLRGEYATFRNVDVKMNVTYFSSLTHILNDSLIVETSIPVDVGSNLVLESKKIKSIDNKEFFVRKRGKEFLSTKFNYRYKLELGSDAIEEGKRVNKEELNDYVNSVGGANSSYRLKLLMVQSDLTVLKQMNKPVSKFPYLIRYLTGFRTKFKMVRNFRPHLISIEFDPPFDGGDEILEKRRIDFEELHYLVEQIKSMEGYNPVIEVFNCDINNEALRQKLVYPLVISSEGKMSFTLLLNMLEVFKSKKSEEDPYEMDPFIDGKENPFAIYALNKESRLKHGLDIKITSLSEHEMTFVSSVELPLRAVLYTEDPVPFYFTVVEPIAPLEKVRGVFHYHSLINGITPSNTKKLRRHVNDLFFRDKEEEKRKELEEFKKLNEEKKQNQNKKS